MKPNRLFQFSLLVWASNLESQIIWLDCTKIKRTFGFKCVLCEYEQSRSSGLESGKSSFQQHHWKRLSMHLKRLLKIPKWSNNRQVWTGPKGPLTHSESVCRKLLHLSLVSMGDTNANARCKRVLTQKPEDMILYYFTEPQLCHSMATEDIKTTLFTQRDPSSSL